LLYPRAVVKQKVLKAYCEPH